MPHLSNHPDAYVDEFVDGLLLAHPDHLRLASGAPRVVVRAEPATEPRVAVVSGGGSGHLPTFVGYVGEGLLDGCAVGNLFASPSAEQILAAALETGSGAGVLFVYGNYTGDRINFTLASEMARESGIEVAEVRVHDDIASGPPDDRQSRRGVAGLGLTIKVAGAAAATGAPLDEVRRAASRAADRTRSMGVALGSCVLPTVGRATFEVETGTMALGMGIHGEPAGRLAPVAPADDVVGDVVDALLTDLKPAQGAGLAVLINGLGATPGEELYLLYRGVHRCLSAHGLRVGRAFVGEYTTSLEMPGFSVTLMELDEQTDRYLAAPSHAPVLRLL